MQEQIAKPQSSKQQTHMDYQNNNEEALELLNECEEETKRMQEEHKNEVEMMSATHLQLVREHEMAMEWKG